MAKLTQQELERRPVGRCGQGQLSAAEGLREFEAVVSEINAEKGAHADLGMDENAFAILRIMEDIVPETDQSLLVPAASAISALYADAAVSQPSFGHMESYLRTLRQEVRRILADHGIGETKAIRD